MTTPAGDCAPSSPVLPLPLIRQGKVRDVYELPPQRVGEPPRLLLVASDRISAFDVVMPTPIEGKGRVLTAMSAAWFRFIAERQLAETHVLSTDVRDIPTSLIAATDPVRTWLNGRVTIARMCKVVPIECVARGYLEGSGWKEYQATGSVCGVRLPPGLQQCDRLPAPIFTPATKEASGHDQNITFEQASELVGLETMGVLRDLTLSIYRAAAAHAQARGLIIADTKFEFGVPTDDASKLGRVWTQPLLIDEAITPDSSRFWPVETYQPGRPQRSYDKQFLREYLEGLVASGRWDKCPPGPALPPEVVGGTLARYREAMDKLWG